MVASREPLGCSHRATVRFRAIRPCIGSTAHDHRSPHSHPALSSGVTRADGETITLTTGARATARARHARTHANRDARAVKRHKGSTSTSDLPSALEHVDEITASGTRRLAVFLDYDGTLTPIVAHPEDAVLHDRMREIVERLARRCPVAVISGRDLADVRARVAIDDIVYAGSHGFDIAGPGGLRPRESTTKVTKTKEIWDLRYGMWDVRSAMEEYSSVCRPHISHLTSHISCLLVLFVVKSRCFVEVGRWLWGLQS